MDYQSKFSLGQEVWLIRQTTAYRQVKCSTCTSTGLLTINKEEFICPKCKGTSAHSQRVGNRWYLDREYPTIIGQIQITDVGNEYLHRTNIEKFPKITYMVSDYGVVSGNVFDEEDLFPSKADAEQACNKRNAGLVFEDESGIEKKKELY
jgi:hypothetical protein